MAIYKTMHEKEALVCGTVVWAYEFQENSKKEGMSLIQKPIKGRISCESHEMIGVFEPGQRSRFFIPFKKNSEVEYAWSKAIRIYNRNFADTEIEAQIEYNQLIDYQISWYQDKIASLGTMKI